MKKSEKKSHKDLVFTGEYLGVVEEFLPDKKSTFVQDGQIFATISGILNIDEAKRELEILDDEADNRKLIKVGDIVIGVILFIRQYSVGLHFYAVNNKIHFNSNYFGNIHVSEISDRYVEKIQDAFQKTDIIRARVIKLQYNEFDLSTSGKNLGVVHADCVVCGTTLKKINFNKLQCPRCGSTETRKLTGDYGNITENLRF